MSLKYEPCSEPLYISAKYKYDHQGHYLNLSRTLIEADSVTGARGIQNCEFWRHIKSSLRLDSMLSPLCANLSGRLWVWGTLFVKF